MSYINLQAEHDKYEKICEDAFQEGKKINSITYADWLDSPWKGKLKFLLLIEKLLRTAY